MIVYVVAIHDEYGLMEPGLATTDRSRLLALFEAQWPDQQHERSELAKALETLSDADLCRAFSTGLSEEWWCRFNLIVMELK